MEVYGPRQNYTFKKGVTYLISSNIDLYGQTVISGGSVLKFDGASNSTLVVHGSLLCDAQPYNYATLTSVDDDSAGRWLYWMSGDIPQTGTNLSAYLDLAGASSSSINNLRICYAGIAVTTPL